MPRPGKQYGEPSFHRDAVPSTTLSANPEPRTWSRSARWVLTISSSDLSNSARPRLAGENVIMLPPGWRTDSVPRTMLAWFSAMANERFGHAMA